MLNWHKRREISPRQVARRAPSVAEKHSIAAKFRSISATVFVSLAIMAILLAASLGAYYGIYNSLSVNAADHHVTFGHVLRAINMTSVPTATVQLPAGQASPNEPQLPAGNHQGSGDHTGNTSVGVRLPAYSQSASQTNIPPTNVPLPETVLLKNVPLGKQARNLSCEFQSASDLVWYYGKPYTWEEIFMRVGHDPGGNPHKGFVGDSLDDPPGRLYPDGYGVYAEPIAAALSSLGLPAKVYYHKSAMWLKEQIATRHPVMIWAIAGMRPSSVETWTASDGTLVRGARGEHTYLVVGYNNNGVWVNNPWNGKQEFYQWRVFLQSWDTFDRMCVVVKND